MNTINLIALLVITGTYFPTNCMNQEVNIPNTHEEKPKVNESNLAKLCLLQAIKGFPLLSENDCYHGKCMLDKQKKLCLLIIQIEGCLEAKVYDRRSNNNDEPWLQSVAYQAYEIIGSCVGKGFSKDQSNQIKKIKLSTKEFLESWQGYYELYTLIDKAQKHMGVEQANIRLNMQLSEHYASMDEFWYYINQQIKDNTYIDYKKLCIVENKDLNEAKNKICDRLYTPIEKITMKKTEKDQK